MRFLSFFVFSAAFFAFACCSEPSEQNPMLAETEEELVVSISVIRHGASSSKYAKLTPNEFVDFGLEEDDFNSLTLLGKVQMWSYGNYVRSLYPSTKPTVFNSKGFASALDKNIDAAEILMAGLLGDYPKWSLGEFPESTTDFLKTSTAPGCDTKFLVDDAIDKDLPENATKTSNYQIHVYDNVWLIDTDRECDLIHDYFQSETAKSFTEKFYDELIVQKGVEEDFLDYLDLIDINEEENVGNNMGTKARLLFLEVALRHTLHNLDLSKEDIGTAKLYTIATNWNNYVEGIRFTMLDISYPNDYFAQLCASDLMSHIVEAMEQGYKGEEGAEKYLMFPVHDNVVFALLYMMLGREEVSANLEKYIPLFATNVRIDLVKVSSGNYYKVRVYWNGKLIQTRFCEAECEFIKMHGALSSLVVEDLEDACSLE